MRVIGGRFRSRVLRAPAGHATRPTTDRVREAWFSILGDLDGARVLDLFAGTGALGIEALSRGAASAVFVDSSRAACEVIRRNLTSLGLEPVTEVVMLPIDRSRRAVLARAPYDLMLSDPPWTDLDEAFRAQLRLLREPALLAPGAQVVLGHPKGAEPALPAELALTLQSTRRWGDAAASFYVAPETAAAPAGADEQVDDGSQDEDSAKDEGG